MGSIADKLSKLMETKSAIKSAITAKGVTVSDSDPFSSYAGKIAQIEGGGGGEGTVGLVDGTITSYSGDESYIRWYAFYGCENLESVSLTKAISAGNSSFYNCSKLNILDMPNLENSEDRAFYGCDALVSVNMPKLKNISEWMFFSCDNLAETNFNSVTEIESYGFRNCPSLSLIILPSAVSIGKSAFASCSSLKALVLPGDQFCVLESIDALDSTPIESGEGYIYVPKNLVSKYVHAANWTRFADQIRAIEDYPDIVNIIATMEAAA